MLYVTIFQTILMLILLILYLYKKNSYQTTKMKYQQLENGENSKNKTDETSNYLGVNRRKYFRLSLNKEECMIKLLEFENNQLDKLKNKQFSGTLENISVDGFKFICSYNLPAKQSIMIEIKFNLKGHNFSHKGQIVRKEEYIKTSLVGYGVKFVDISDEEQGMLLKTLNEIMIERRKEIS